MQTAIGTESDPLPPAFTEQDQQRELATLSPAEIAKAEADVLGITSGLAGLGIKEAERDAGLRQLDEELSKIPDDQKATYLEAVERCPDMVNAEHKVAFLEREAFDAKLAAQRLVRYWETKLDVFGPERCFLPLTLEGAMKDQVSAMLQYCEAQVLPVKDTSGRAIIMIDPSRRDRSKFSSKQASMAWWYMVEAATEDPEVRKRGIVTLSYQKNLQIKHFDPAGYRLIMNITLHAVPVSVRSIHVCHPNPVAYYVLYPAGKYLIGKELRLRIKLHYGSTEHVLQELGMYCLPRDRVPSELGGDLVLDLAKWFSDRSELESKRLHLEEQRLTYGKTDTEGRPSKRMRGFEAQSKDIQRDNNESDSSSLPCAGAAPSLPEAVKEKKTGRKADPRMNNAVLAKLSSPDMSAHEALIRGGFDFPSPVECNGIASEKIFDSENVSLKQRRNQLCRRIRQAKKMQYADACGNDAQKATGEYRPNAAYSGIVSEPFRDVSSNHELPDVDVDTRSCPEKNGHERRDSFYECVMELPGLDGLDGLNGHLKEDEKTQSPHDHYYGVSY